MLKIGLTGGIGSGKSTLADLFAQYNVPIVDADIIARDLTKQGTPSYQAIIDHFGQSYLNPDKSLNRPALREQCFNHPDDRLWLENLLHPLVRQRIKEETAKLEAPYCVVVIPLLSEEIRLETVDRVLKIDAPIELKIERAKKRDQSSSTIIKKIIAVQNRKHMARSDDSIVNDGSLEALQEKAYNLHQRYLQLAAKLRSY